MGLRDEADMVGKNITGRGLCSGMLNTFLKELSGSEPMSKAKKAIKGIRRGGIGRSRSED